MVKELTKATTSSNVIAKLLLVDTRRSVFHGQRLTVRYYRWKISMKVENREARDTSGMTRH